MGTGHTLVRAHNALVPDSSEAEWEAKMSQEEVIAHMQKRINELNAENEQLRDALTNANELLGEYKELIETDG